MQLWEVQFRRFRFSESRCFFHCPVMTFVLLLFARAKLRVIQQEVFCRLCFLIMALPVSRTPKIFSGFASFQTVLKWISIGFARA